MRATGIVRRIDELGRVVIPKEIRRTMKLREGEELEVLTTDSNELVLKKYSAVGEMDILTKEYARAVAKTTGYTVVVTDMDKIVAKSGALGEFHEGDALSFRTEKLLGERKSAVLKGEEVFPLFGEEGGERPYMMVLSPLMKGGDLMGGFFLLHDKEMNTFCDKLADTATAFLQEKL